MLLNEKIYWSESITTILWTYVLKVFSEQLNVVKVDGDGITPMKNFAGTTTEITLKIAIHEAVQFMSWMQDFKAIYICTT